MLAIIEIIIAIVIVILLALFIKNRAQKAYDLHGRFSIIKRWTPGDRGEYSVMGLMADSMTAVTILIANIRTLHINKIAKNHFLA